MNTNDIYDRIIAKSNRYADQKVEECAPLFEDRKHALLRAMFVTAWLNGYNTRRAEEREGKS
jgi:hypothetical protein